MRLQAMTWQEVNDLDRSTVVVASFGAMEQHGPHLPIETDARIAQELAARLDDAFDGRLLVLPTQWLGLSTHHMSFSGTISASIETYLAMANEILGSLAHAGFTKFVVLNSHGGNASALDLVLTKCHDKFPSTTMVAVTYWNAAAVQLRLLRDSSVGGMGHACELETSMILATSPELVHIDRAKPDGGWSTCRFLSQDMLSSGSASVARTFDEISTSGTVGDPRSASAEKGEQFYTAIVEQLAELVRDLEQGHINQFRLVGK
jgi:creatinine amidohydrolase